MMIDRQKMKEQFPRDGRPDDLAPVGDEEAYLSCPVHDRVLTLAKSKFTEREAGIRFAALCLAGKWRPTEKAYYTAKYWCMRVVKLRGV